MHVLMFSPVETPQSLTPFAIRSLPDFSAIRSVKKSLEEGRHLTRANLRFHRWYSTKSPNDA